MEIEVKGCGDCPFKAMGGWEGEYNICSITEQKLSGANYEHSTKKPKWCPLKKENITVKLETKTNLT